MLLLFLYVTITVRTADLLSFYKSYKEHTVIEKLLISYSYKINL